MFISMLTHILTSMFTHLILTSLIYLMYLGWNPSHSLVEQTCRFTSQLSVHESNDWRSQHRLLEKWRKEVLFVMTHCLVWLPKWLRFMKIGKKINSLWWKKLHLGGTINMNSASFYPWRVPLPLETRRSCTVTGHVEEVRVHPGGREPAVINKPPPNMSGLNLSLLFKVSPSDECES